MKRSRPNEAGCSVRPPGWSENQDDSDEEENNSLPPARKILKSLLENEVEKAIHNLNDDTISFNHVKSHRAASLIPEFDPDGEDCTVTSWLKKIDQLGDIHGWDEKIKAFYLQDKLRGQARKWYNRLENYDYSWAEWKHMLVRAFPKHRDFSLLLNEMMQRKKLPNETMTKYYQDKIAMCFRCHLSDSASVSCIIRGLPVYLQPNARAFQCQRPDELYESFLCALDDYHSPTFEPRMMTKDTKQSSSSDKKVNPEIDPCPRCKKTGHMLRNCTLPDQRICFKCGQQGHIATRCSGTSASNSRRSMESNDNIKEVRMVQNYNEIYKKVAKVNGIYIKSYIDTGSQVNVINVQMVSLLSLDVTPTSTRLKSFSGDFLTSRGVVEFELEIDNIHIQCTAHVTEADMQDIHLLIGQPVINAEHVSLVVTNGRATLTRKTDVSPEFDVVEDKNKFMVTTLNKESLPPGASIIKVRVVGNGDGNEVCTTPRHYELHGVSYSLPATLLHGGEGYMKVVNSGTGDVNWEAGQVLARAESCHEVANQPTRVSQAKPLTNLLKIMPNTPYLAKSSPESKSIAPILNTDDLSSLIIGGVPISEISVGKLNEVEHSSLIQLLLRFKHTFAANTRDLGCTKLLEMKIKLTTPQPIYRQPYKLSHAEQQIVNSKVRDLLDASIIKESESSYAAPVILVRKKNGDSRLCVDYRALNNVTVKDGYPLPNIEDQISKLAGKKYFTILDMAQSYHQLLLAPEDTHKTAFITPQGHYEYLRVPFGLANAPSVFMRLVNKIVDSIRYTSDGSSSNEILAFLDDLLLPSIDINSGIKMLESVLRKFESENLKLNMQKCSFLQDEVTYLGHEITSKGVQPSDSKLDAVSKFPVPKSVHELVL
ncbi:unnamed protein product [Danaus chrysippus]|uniref:(African queen) hypothetical protein n=1 Tax=Danaus chrysippus TaxID=151541 RepID=A0A8J2QJ64_9NEOP|nr:unnamed protein product [Danaus chrysippus]